MLIYVIPFVLLLIVAIVLKKREASKQADSAPKKTATTRNKSKTSTSKQKTPLNTESHVHEAPAVEKKHATQLSTDLKKQIQDLIRDRNFFAAEAQINQALNKDNTQHELYLLLLDIHLQQKDDFAIGQLFNHLRSLELEETIAQAEQKKAEYEQEHAAEVETPAQQQTTISVASAATSNSSNSFDFDALIQDKPLTATLNDEKKSEPAAADQPLEFKSFSLSPEITAPTSQQESTSDTSTLQFELKQDTPQKTEAAQEQSLETELKDLEFSFSLDPAPITETPSLDITPAKEEKTEEIEEKPEFKFSFDLEQPAATEATTQIETSSLPSLSFDLEPQKTELVTELAIPLEICEPAASVTSTEQDDVNLQDPLVQSFPELSQINETTLNLDLAQQYIQLGSYDAARHLLAANTNKFSAEQQQRAEQLLNQIAS